MELVLTLSQIKRIASKEIKTINKECHQALKGKLDSYRAKYGSIWLGDISDNIRFYNLILQEEWREAFSCLQDMDTDPRGNIDENVVDFLYDKMNELDDEDK
jgi:hypothetical protein